MIKLPSILTLLCLLLISCNTSTSNKTQVDSNIINKDITVEETKSLLKNNKEITLIDLRTDDEIARGMIIGAKQMDYKSASFKDDLKSLDKSKPYIVYCASGGRSGKTLKMMADLGFVESYNMLGGFQKWQSK